MPNRVAELESRVTELEATVHGLTEELVDVSERLRAIESGADGQGDAQYADDATTGRNGRVPATDASGHSTESAAGVSQEGSANTTKRAEHQEPNTSEETEGQEASDADAPRDRDDIIVA